MKNNSNTLPTRNEPTDLVNCTIMLNGKEMSGVYKMTSLNIQRCYNRIASARIQLADGDAAKQDFAISSQEDALTPGGKIEILMGYHNQSESVFKGVVVSHAIRSGKDKHSALIIEARDMAYKLCLRRGNHTFSDQPDSDMIGTLAKGSGYAPADLDISSTSFRHPQMVQYNVTPWDFILSRAEMNGMLVLTDSNKLVIRPPDTAQKPAVEIAYGIDVISFESTLDGRSQLKEIKTHSWNYKDQKVEESPDASLSFSESGNLKAADLADALGGAADNLVHGGSLGDEELKSWGNARLLKSRLAKICGRLTTKGTSSVKPGQMISLKGFGLRFNGPVLVTGIVQHYDQSIWETEVQFGMPAHWFYEKEDIADKPAAGLIPGINGLQTGIVLQLENDPDKQDRIKVQLPLVDSHEGIWARVASLDAGDGRGCYFRPELKDEVLVGFLHDDPRHPVILGMLNSSAKPSPIEAKDSNHEKGFVTRSKMKFLFNDDKKTAILETPAGKKIAVDEDKDAIELSDQHGNKISMGPDGIVIESGKDLQLKAASGDITLQGINISNKANAQFGAEGNASASLQSSGQTVVKGSIVNIN